MTAWKGPIMKPILLLSITVMVSALVVSSPSQILPSALGDVDPSPTGDPWRPYGPYVRQIQVKTYQGEFAEFQDFRNGNLDLPEWLLSKADAAAFQANPDMRVSEEASDAGKFQINPNHYRGLFGVPGLHARTVGDIGDGDFDGLRSTKQPNPAFVQVMQGLSHLFDKQSFTSEAYDGSAVPNDCASSRIGGGCTGAAPTQWDTLHPGTVSAYNLVVDTGLGGRPGAMDIEAAKDHFRVAGISTNPATGRFVSSERIDFLIRSDDVNRKNAGIILADAIDSLFDPIDGLPVVDRTFGNIGQLGGIVFLGLGDDASKKDWSLYTGGHGLGTDASHLRVLYGSEFASNICGGAFTAFTLNYGFVCDPEFDAWAEEMELGCVTLTCYNIAARNALDMLGKHAATIELWSRAARFVVHKGWNGVVNHLGSAYPAFYSFLNMRQDPNFVSTGGLGPPGGGVPDLLRFGMRQSPQNLNIFHARTAWDNWILFSLGIYDYPTRDNPLRPQIVTGVYNWMVSRTEEIFGIDLTLNPLGPDSLPNTGDEGKVTVVKLHLRNDVFFHNGWLVSPNDIVKSVIAYRDVLLSSFLTTRAVSGLLTAREIGTNTVELVWSGHNNFRRIDTLFLRVFPVALWDTNGDGFICAGQAVGSCILNNGPDGLPSTLDDVPRPADPTTSATYDPLANGILIGSGPFQCYTSFDSTGRGVGSCSRNPDGTLGGQTVDPGGTYLLSRFDGFHRCCPENEDSSLGRFSWADINDDGRVDITDISSVAVRFGLDDPYWDHSIFGVRDNEVDIAEVSTAAFYFDHGLITPFEMFEGMDPDVDPYR